MIRTPKNEVHLEVLDEAGGKYLGVPAGHHLRIYSKKKGGRIYLAHGPDRKHWEDIGQLDMPTLHAIFYDLGLIDAYEEESDDAPVDMLQWRMKRHFGG